MFLKRYTELNCGIQCTAPQRVWTFKAQLLRRIPAWITHPSDPRSRLTARLLTWQPLPEGCVPVTHSGVARRGMSIVDQVILPLLTQASLLGVVCTSETASFCARMLAHGNFSIHFTLSHLPTGLQTYFASKQRWGQGRRPESSRGCLHSQHYTFRLLVHTNISVAVSNEGTFCMLVSQSGRNDNNPVLFHSSLIF